MAAKPPPVATPLARDNCFNPLLSTEYATVRFNTESCAQSDARPSDVVDWRSESNLRISIIANDYSGASGGTVSVTVPPLAPDSSAAVYVLSQKSKITEQY